MPPPPDPVQAAVATQIGGGRVTVTRGLQTELEDDEIEGFQEVQVGGAR